jgi:hypothetical protein
LFSYTLFAQEADQNPNSLTYEQYVKERQEQQQLLLKKNTPRAALDDDEINDLLEQLQVMQDQAKKMLSEFAQRRSLRTIYQHELFTVYRYYSSHGLTFSLHLGTDLNGNSMEKESEAKIYRETRHPELQESYAQITKNAIEAIKKELPSMTLKEKEQLLKKALYNIENYRAHYEKLLQAQKKFKQGVAGSRSTIQELEKILKNLESKKSTCPNPLLVLLFKKPELLKEEDSFI